MISFLKDRASGAYGSLKEKALKKVGVSLIGKLLRGKGGEVAEDAAEELLAYVFTEGAKVAGMTSEAAATHLRHVADRIGGAEVGHESGK